jgi:tetratricopeptide (TPR) repeat protein
LNVFIFDEEKTRVFQNAAQRRHFNLKAIADSTEAIRLDPQNADAYCNRGDAHSDGYDYDRAIADYSESIRLEPNVARLYLKRRLQYSRKGDYHKALADLREALRLAPEICHQDDHIVVDVGDTPLDIGMRLTETEVREGEDEYGEGTFTVVKGAEGFRKFIAEGNRFSK